MTRYLASRFAGMVVVMLLVATLVFFITRLAPGDPAAVMLGEQATAADIAQLRASYGLDKPLPVQFAYWLRELARGNLGQSIFLQRPVTQALLERAEPTFFLTLFSIVIATLIGVPCGIVAAVWRGRRDRPGLLRLRDAGREHPELLVRPDPDADLRRRPRLVSGRRLRRSGRAARRPPASPGAAGDRARRRQLGADPALHAREHARRARRGPHPHGARQGRVGAARGPASCLAQRADPGAHRARPHVRAAGRRRDRHRDRVRPARHRQPRRLGGAAPRLSGDPGRAARDRRPLRADQPGDRPAVPGRRSARDATEPRCERRAPSLAEAVPAPGRAGGRGDPRRRRAGALLRAVDHALRPDGAEDPRPAAEPARRALVRHRRARPRRVLARHLRRALLAPDRRAGGARSR